MQAYAGYAGSFLFRYHKPQNMTVRQDLFVEFMKGDRAVDVTYFYPAVGSIYSAQKRAYPLEKIMI